MTLRSRARQQQLWGDVTGWVSPCSCFGQEIERLTLTPSRRGPPFASASQNGLPECVCRYRDRSASVGADSARQRQGSEQGHGP